MPAYPYTGERYSKYFWRRFVRFQNGCLVWQGARNSAGYGIVGFLGKSENVHIVSWILTHGFKPTKGIFVCHSCNNKSCGEPTHLYLADNSKNQLDHQRDRIRELHDRYSKIRT